MLHVFKGMECYWSVMSAQTLVAGVDIWHSSYNVGCKYSILEGLGSCSSPVPAYRFLLTCVLGGSRWWHQPNGRPGLSSEFLVGHVQPWLLWASWIILVERRVLMILMSLCLSKEQHHYFLRVQCIYQSSWSMALPPIWKEDRNGYLAFMLAFMSWFQSPAFPWCYHKFHKLKFI